MIYALKSINIFHWNECSDESIPFSVKNVEHISDLSCDQKFGNLRKKMLRNNFLIYSEINRAVTDIFRV